MPYLKNATKEEITIKAAGNFFRFKPHERKWIASPELARWITSKLRDSGIFALPVLPGTEDDPAASLVPESEDDKKRLAELTSKEEAAALDRYLAKHRQVIQNNQVSLRRDLEQANIKTDPKYFATDGEIDSMRIVASYQKRDEDVAEAKAKEIDRLLSQAPKGK